MSKYSLILVFALIFECAGCFAEQKLVSGNYYSVANGHFEYINLNFSNHTYTYIVNMNQCNDTIRGTFYLDQSNHIQIYTRETLETGDIYCSKGLSVFRYREGVLDLEDITASFVHVDYEY